MANPNNPFGFRPVTRAGGSPFSFRTYGKPASDANAIYAGDLLIKVAAGVALAERTDYNVPGCQTGYQGTPGTSYWLGSSVNYGAASTLTNHQVTDEPDVIYLVQGKTGTTYSTASHVGKNANISLSTAGSSTTKQSGMTLDGATLATTSTLDLKTIDIAMITPNAEGANAIFEVLINRHEVDNQTAGV